MKSLGHRAMMVVILCLVAMLTGAADPGSTVGIGIDDPPIITGCFGTPGQWSGCRGNGCSVCSELVALYPLYFEHHPVCSPNNNCAGLYYTCNEACPAPTSADRCNGTYGQWSGCRGNGCSVCAELVAEYPLYFINHPSCSPNLSCGGSYYTCNERCPAPTAADRCSTTPGDVNLNGLVCDIGDAVMLERYLGCLDDLNADQIANADLNADCKVDEADSAYMLECVSGGPDPLPCDCQEPEVTGCRCSLTGDVNLNGLFCEIGDAVLLSRFLGCLDDLSDEQITNSDVNGDCEVNQDDVDYLLDTCIGGGIDPVPCVCGTPHVDGCRCSLPGDVNGNGLVEIADVVLLTSFLNCGVELDEEQIRNSDVNGDCRVDWSDVDYLTDYLVGGPAPLPCVCESPEVTACRCSLQGDVNSNGLVEIADVVLLNSFLACSTELDDGQIRRSDVNGDCLVEQADADYLLAYISGSGPAPLDCVCDNPEVTDCRCSSPGDTNSNGLVADIGDVIYLGNFLCSGGPAPDPLVNGNIDGDCDVDLDDYNALLDIVTNGGTPAPCVCHNPSVGACE